MRFDRLHLLRYGPFTDRRLVFSPEASLHIVYGANEAGKSSALAAIADLLFGFERSVSNNFVHKAPTLRVGAALSVRSGQRIEFRRRRGDKDTLLDDADHESAMQEDALAPYIGRLSREVFARAFGLDSERLRRGADAMLQPKGEIGAVMMAAARGLTGLSQMSTTLEAEAEELYGPKKSKNRRFYQAQGRHEEAAKAERDAILNGPAWRELQTRIEAARRKLDEAEEQSKRVLAREQWLRTVLSVRTIVAKVKAAEAALAEHTDLATLPDGLPQEMDALNAKRTTAQLSVQEPQQAVDKCEQALGRITVDEAVVAKAAEIAAVHSGKLAYEENLKALPEAEAKLADAQKKVDELFERLGVTQADARGRPSDAALTRARVLLTAEEKRGVRRRDAHKQHEEAVRALAGLDDPVARRIVDPTDAKANFKSLQVKLRDLAERTALVERRRRKRRQLDEKIAALRPPARLEQLIGASLPSAEVLNDQRAKVESHPFKLEARSNRLDELRRERDEAGRDRLVMERAGTIPSRTILDEARSARDAAFDRVADHVVGASVLAPDAAAVAVVQVRALTGEADRLVDQSVAEADRVATHAALSEKERRLTLEVAEQDRHLAALGATHERALHDFSEPFRAIGIEPLGPAQMADWRHAVADVLALREEAEAIDDRLVALSDVERGVRASLDAIGDALAMPRAMLPVDNLAAKVDKRIEELEQAWTEHRTKDELRRLHEETARAAAAILEAVAEEEAGAATELAAAAAALGLREDARWEELGAVVGLWQDLPDRRAAQDACARLLDTLRRRRAAYETRVAVLARALDPEGDLATVDAAVAAERMHEMSATAARAKAKHEAAQEALAEAQVEFKLKRCVLASAEAAYQDALGRLPPTDDADALVDRLRHRDEARVALNDARRRFAEVAPAADEAAVREELACNDAAAIQVELDRLDLDARDHREAVKEHYAARVAAENDREALEAGPGAEGAAFAKNAAATEMADIARRWTVLRLASTILKEAVERQRKRHSAPLLERAGGLFAAITNHAFDGLTQRYGEGDVLQLLAVRRGEPLPIAALSDGTRDQLYLALRLAFVEDYATRNEPAPFIGDDLFQTFDDDRTAAGLAALAEIGGTVQPILFAHHKSVVEIARGRLGNSVDVIALD